MPALRRRSLLVAGIAALVLAGAACGDDDDGIAGGTVPLYGGTLPSDGPALDLTPDQPTGGRRVVMIGDSITLAAVPFLESQAAELGIELTIHAEVGRRINLGRPPPPGTDVVSEVVNGDTPDLFVIALGTNDIGKYDSVAEYREPIADLLGLVPDDAPIVWINTYLERSVDSSATFNAALIAALQQRGNATIGEWSDIAQVDGVLSDGIHPSDAGAERFAGLVIDEIEFWIG
jgi:hypothetical protein